MRLEALTTHGRLQAPDPITGGATAIGRVADTFAAASGHARVAALRSDFPAAVRSRDAGTHAAIAASRRAIEKLNPQSGAVEISARWLQSMIEDNSTDALVRDTCQRIRKRVSVLPAAQVEQRLNEALEQLAGGAEFDVYYSQEDCSVYKLTRVHPFIPGVLRGGWLPGALMHSGDSVSAEKGESTSILDLFERIAMGNRSGSVVFTEIAAVLTDGRVLLKQPFIDPGRATTKEERMCGLPGLDFEMLDLEEGLLALWRDEDGSLWVVGDLHEKNVLMDDALSAAGKGGVFVIDYSARRLTDTEQDQLRGRI